MTTSFVEGHAARQDVAGASRAFLIVWSGQLISMLGTGMASFAITLWVWQTTGKATALTTIELLSFTVVVIMGPVMGYLVDRFDRRATLALGDIIGAATGAVLIAVSAAGRLAVWHIYVAKLLLSAFQSLQAQAMAASVSTLLPKHLYARANGLSAFAVSAAATGAPVAAAALLACGGMTSVLVVDVVSCVVAVIAVLAAALPRVLAGARRRQVHVRVNALHGFARILARPGLRNLTFVSAGANFLGMFGILMPVMVLARTHGDRVALGVIVAMSGLGGLAGGALASLLPAPRSQLRRALWGFIAIGLLGQTLSGLTQSLAVWAAAGFMSTLIFPIIHGSIQAIWQANIEPEMQGRVFGARRLLAEAPGPVALLIAGPLADRIFEPAMAVGGTWAPKLGAIVGTGPGAGMALVLVLTGLLEAALGAAGLCLRRSLRIEDLRTPAVSLESAAT